MRGAIYLHLPLIAKVCCMKNVSWACRNNFFDLLWRATGEVMSKLVKLMGKYGCVGLDIHPRRKRRQYAKSPERVARPFRFHPTQQPKTPTIKVHLKTWSSRHLKPLPAVAREMAIGMATGFRSRPEADPLALYSPARFLVMVIIVRYWPSPVCLSACPPTCHLTRLLVIPERWLRSGDRRIVCLPEIPDGCGGGGGGGQVDDLSRGQTK
ncbi:hypothetical protein B0F90DRAFT_1915960 [Multifurca ochricompacta]|uniref:Uncharacterized protein n=1 Tax=Multifurca ochricompacta TaxID=376703 RepID=A0AAD4M8I0_9AGAM|nr:hypothetical protein B0F90DRAFT_1915960 [Multifurca ochricompacta]